MGFIKSGLIGRRGGMTRAAWGGRRVEPQEGQTLLFIWPEPAVFVCGGRTTESIRDEVRPDFIHCIKQSENLNPKSLHIPQESFSDHNLCVLA